jgi:hypothetical protein
MPKNTVVEPLFARSDTPGDFYIIISYTQIRAKYPARLKFLPPSHNAPEGWSPKPGAGNPALLFFNKNLNFSPPALPIQPGGEDKLLLLLEKLVPQRTPRFLEFLGIRFPPGLKG